MLEPDWSAKWTKVQAEKELSNFSFNGPGIYSNDEGDSILVVPVDRPRDETWNQHSRPGEEFHFFVYNRRNIADILNLMIGAPSRS